jgi:hypothetical protein
MGFNQSSTKDENGGGEAQDVVPMTKEAKDKEVNSSSNKFL